MIQTDLKLLKHIEFIWNYLTVLLCLIVVRAWLKCWTTSNLCETTQKFILCLIVVQTGSKVWNHLELVWNYPKSWFTLSNRNSDLRVSKLAKSPSLLFLINCGSSRFKGLEPPQTHVKLPQSPSLLCLIVVRACSKVSNHPKVMWNDLRISSLLCLIVVQAVRKFQTSTNSCETTQKL